MAGCRALNRCRDCFDHARGDLVLDRENVAGFAVVTRRPELEARTWVHQACRHPNPPGSGADAAFEDLVHVESARERPEVIVLPARAERRRSGCHANPVDPGKRAHDLLGHPFAEILLVLPRTHVGERKHGDGDRVCGQDRRALPAPERLDGADDLARGLGPVPRILTKTSVD